MFQLLSGRVLKPLAYKNVMKHNNDMVRSFSSYMQMTYPYVLIDHVLKVGEELRRSIRDSPDGRIDRGIETCHVKEIVIKDEDLEEDIRDAMNVGHYRSYDRFEVVMYNGQSHLSNIDNVRLHLSMYNDPSNPNVGPKELRLPYLPTGTQIQNVAMSSCQNNEDLVVAVKLLGSQIKVYRPASHDNDFRWIDIETIHESIGPYSCIMYSKKDQRFYTPSPGGEYLCSFDHSFKEKDKPELIRLYTNSLPPYWMLNMDDLIPTMSRTDHLVESPSGEQFLIKWYYGDHLRSYNVNKFMHQTKGFMVFKEEGPSTDKKGKIMSYTEDIGDLCILLGRNEAFCFQASSSLGLRPNCIYFVGYNYGVFDITTKICTLFTTEEGQLRSTDFPYWTHPLSINPN